jgi:hypothetical protein
LRAPAAQPLALRLVLVEDRVLAGGPGGRQVAWRVCAHARQPVQAQRELLANPIWKLLDLPRDPRRWFLEDRVEPALRLAEQDDRGLGEQHISRAERREIQREEAPRMAIAPTEACGPVHVTLPALPPSRNSMRPIGAAMAAGMRRQRQ